MDLYDALLSRRTVFKYQARPVEEAVIDRALEAARWAPNHKLTEPWRFTVVGPKTRAALGQVARRLAEKKAAGLTGDAFEAVLDRQEAKVRDLPALVIVSMRLTPDDAFRQEEDYAAACCALHNLSLSLWADGVGSQWGTGGVTRDAESYDVLDIDRAQERIIGFVKLGYPEKVPQSRRRDLEEVTRHLP